MRGRVMALYMTVLMGGTPIGSPFIGWVGQEFGARYSLIVGGGMTILGTVASVLYFSRRRGLAIRPRLLPRPRLEVLPQTELLGEKAAVDAAPQPVESRPKDPQVA
jgi:MFS family permease